MNGIEFTTAGSSSLGVHDFVIVLDNEDPLEALVEGVIQSIDTSLDITLGGKTVFLAMLRNPEHWSEEWAERLGLDRSDPDVDVEEAAHEFIAGLVAVKS